MDKQHIKSKIDEAQACVNEHGAKLCAVIKNRTLEEIDYAVNECGIELVGENRVQELLSHYELLSRSNVKIHFIGKLQTNKVKYIADKVDMIESVDSIKLCEEIEKRMSKLGKKVDILIEINIGEEEQKSGILPSRLESFIDEIKEFTNIVPRGLMTVAPVCQNPEDYDVYFKKTKDLLDGVFMKKLPNTEKPILSMGMSSNYKRALSLGSTEVRIGTGIFGPRQTF